MITVISGTNRPDSKSVLIARHYQTLLQELGQETTLLDLAHLPHTFTAAEFLYAPSLATQEFAQLSRFISEGRGSGVQCLLSRRVEGVYRWAGIPGQLQK